VAAIPVPDNDSVACDATPVKVRFADAPPADCGVKMAVNDTLLPAAIVTGNEIPFIVNSELLTLAEDTTTLAPDALRFPDRFALAPTVTLPKLKAPGVTFNTPAVPAEPERGIVKPGLLETTEMLPDTVLELVGVKVTLSVMLCPAVKVSGRPGPVTLN
jgi:hypothetical protein